MPAAQREVRCLLRGLSQSRTVLFGCVHHCVVSAFVSGSGEVSVSVTERVSLSRKGGRPRQVLAHSELGESERSPCSAGQQAGPRTEALGSGFYHHPH